MKLAVGENIKFIRKSKDLSQEALAEMLGVSCQSVSRWETGACYPDIELLPVIAEIFGISVDKLLGVDDIVEKKKVNEYLERFQIAISQGKIDECISIAREGAEEYPNNYAILNKLMYALFASGDEDGNIPNWKENMEKYDEEIVSLGERIIKYCPEQHIRLEATSRLAFQHCEMGRKAIGREIYETLPPQILCRENQMWWGLEENEKLSFTRRKINQDYNSLKNDICLLAFCRLVSDEESAAVAEKIFELEALICDGNLPEGNFGKARNNCETAKIYARLGNIDEVYKHLLISAKSAYAFDNREQSQTFSSLLLGDIELKKTDFETADTRGLCEIMRDKWLSDSAFDNIRSTENFAKIIAFLNHSDSHR